MIGWLEYYSVIVLLIVDVTASDSLGGWGQWGPWSSCSVTCGFGSIKRNKQWEYPDGRTANYTLTKIVECFINTTCPTHGGWGMWTGWTRCPVMCGGANVTRTRLCNAPVPSNGGRFCNGSSTDSMICGNSTCPEIPPGFEMMSCFNASMFVCESGEHCVPKSMRCDIKLNCHDGTDEKDCIISLGMGINSSIQKSKFLAVIFTLLTIWEKLFVTWMATTTVIPVVVFHGCHPTDVIVFTYVDTLSYIRWTLVFCDNMDQDKGPWPLT